MASPGKPLIFNGDTACCSSHDIVAEGPDRHRVTMADDKSLIICFCMPTMRYYQTLLERAPSVVKTRGHGAIR